MKADSIWNVVLRVVQRSGQPYAQLLIGIMWRIAERLFDVLPILICYWWLHAILIESDTTDFFSPSIATVTALLLGVFVLQLLSAIYGQRNSFLGGYSIMGGYREKLLDRVHQLPLGTLYRYRAGQLTDMMTDDVLRVENIFTHLVIEVLTSILIPIMLIIGLMWVDWQLSLALIVGLPFAFCVLQVTRKWFVKMSLDKQAIYRSTSGVTVEFVSGIKTLRLYNRAELWLKKLYFHFDEMIHLTIKVEQWGAIPVVLYRLLLELGLALFLLMLASKVNSDDSSPMVLLLFMLLAHRIISPLVEVGQHLTILRYALQSESKLKQLYDQVLLSEPEQAAEISEFSIRFDNVSFGYESTQVLHNISFTAQHKTITAIVGPSGSGKSTIMNLLTRYYDPDQGSIKIGQNNIKAIGSEGLYQHVSMVFQQVQLFNGTIMENVRIGRPTASDEEVFTACKMANCDKFIARLPTGYQTLVGESGASLSGGERQRLSIARALLKDAPIILLDEATASVDPLTQHHIQQALSELVKNKTVIMIAHRLSTIRDANQILVLDDGKLVQRGCHNELLKQDGLYQELWSAEN